MIDIWIYAIFPNFEEAEFQILQCVGQIPPHSKQHNSDKLSDLIMVWALLYEYIINYQALESNPKEQVWLCWR